MAAEFTFWEDNGAATGSPVKGTARNEGVGQTNWKSIDDTTTDYQASPIVAGNNSMTKYQFGRITGTFTEISNAKWAHTAGALPANVTLKGKVTSAYATPSVDENAALTEDMTAITAIGDGQDVLFSEIGPEDVSPSATLEDAGYTQYLVTQIQTTAAAGVGAVGPVVLTLRYDEV